MANYVLVHGAWGGGQTYGDIPDRLEEAGHEVELITLRGLGSRQSELRPGITLSDHIEDVLDQIEDRVFPRFILAGHSYGGMVITGVAAKLGRRIDAICYIDAFLPGDGQSLWDITGEFEHKWYIDTQKFKPGFVDPIGQTGFTPVPGIVGYHPLLTLLEAVRLTGNEAVIPRKSYIFANAWQPTPFPRFAEQVKDDPAWEYHEAVSDHFVMQNAPDLTFEVLSGLAK